MVAAVRPAGAPIEGLAFTRLVPRGGRRGPARRRPLLSTVYERRRAMPESLGVAAELHARARSGRARAGAPGAPRARPRRRSIEAATAPATGPAPSSCVASGSPPRRRPARARRSCVAIARILQQELSDTDGALAALEEARAVEPRRAPVLQNLKRGYEVLGRWASAIEVTGALADARAHAGRPRRAPLRAGAHRPRAPAGRGAAPRAGSSRRSRTIPRYAEARAALTRLRSSLTPPEPMPRPGAEPERRGRAATRASRARGRRAEPGDELDPSTHARAFAEHLRQGRNDAAFLSAMALEELGAADVDAHMLLEQFRSVAPVRARGTLDAAGWELLRPYGMDEVLTAAFRRGGAAPACLARVEQLDGARAPGRARPRDAPRREQHGLGRAQLPAGPRACSACAARTCSWWPTCPARSPPCAPPSPRPPSARRS